MWKGREFTQNVPRMVKMQADDTKQRAWTVGMERTTNTRESSGYAYRRTGAAAGVVASACARRAFLESHVAEEIVPSADIGRISRARIAALTGADLVSLVRDVVGAPT